MSENDQLHDMLERQSERIQQMHVELATKDKHIAELDADRKAIALSLDGIVEHSGHHMQAERVAMLLDKYRNSQHNVIKYAKERNQLRRQLAATLSTIEAATHDGRTYAEGCKP